LKNHANTFLLESVEGNKNFARYSFIGFNPNKIIKTGDKEKFKNIDPLNKLEEQLENIKTPKLEGLPEFNSGAVGFISYEAVSYFEPSINKIEDQTSYFPESIFFITSSLIIFDNEDNKVFIISHADLRDSENFEKEYEKSIDEIKTISQVIESSLDSEEEFKDTDNDNVSLKVNYLTPKEEFMNSVEETKKLIYSGEMIQAVLSQKITVEVEAQPIDIFSSLRKINPSPYMFLLDCDEFKIIGSSPELLVKLQNGKTKVHPIC
jgi:Anthranilate/para-aminobenzoate synthases component I